jgi:hypothetical protein
MSTNFKKISYIIDNNIKYKLKHRNLPRVKKSQCSYFLQNGLINTNIQFDPMWQYYKILCVLKGLKRIDVIHIWNTQYKSDPKLLKVYINMYKILLICSKLGMNIIYLEKEDNLYFDGIIFHKNNYLLAIMYYFALYFKKNNKYIFTKLELEIIKEFSNNSNKEQMIKYINRDIILWYMPEKLKFLFKTLKKKKINNSYKKKYANHLKIMYKNKKIMNDYYNDIISNTMKKYNKYIDSKEFKLFFKKNKKNIKTFNITQKIIFSEIKHEPEIKNKISIELDKIK